MRYAFGRVTRLSLLGLVMVMLLSLLLVRLPFLIAADQDNSIVLMLPLALERNFSLEYVHSVQKTPVQENFSMGHEDRLELVSTVYESLGVGLPYHPNEGVFYDDHGRFVLTGLVRHFPEIELRAMPVAEQALVFGRKRYELNDYFDPGSLIRLKVERCTPWLAIRHKFKP